MNTLVIFTQSVIEKATLTINTAKKNRLFCRAGAYLNEKRSVNMSYFGFGKYPNKGKLSIPGENNKLLDTEKAIGFATFTLAFHF